MDGLSSLLVCLLGHHRHVPGAGRQHVPAGVPGCGQGQGQRRDDDILPQRRAPAQLAAAADARQPGLQRNGGSLAPAHEAALRFSTLTPEAASALAGGRSPSQASGCQRPASTKLTKDVSPCSRRRQTRSESRFLTGAVAARARAERRRWRGLGARQPRVRGRGSTASAGGRRRHLAPGPGAAFLCEPLNFRARPRPCSVVEGAPGGSAGFGGTEAFLAGSSHTHTHSRCPLEGAELRGGGQRPRSKEWWF